MIDAHKMTAIVLMAIQLHLLRSQPSPPGAVTTLLDGESNATRAARCYSRACFHACMPRVCYNPLHTMYWRTHTTKKALPT